MKTRKVVKSINSVVMRFLATVGLGFFGVFAIIGLTGLGYLIKVNADLPSYQELADRDVAESSKLYSRDGTLLYEFHGEYNRTSVDLDRISPYLREATVAVEDKDFYHHGAVSLTSIARAFRANYESGSTVQGGSTITQQFVKNALLDRKKLFSRKIREVLLAYKVESHFSKDEILGLYLNEIPYGRNAYGAEAASQSYFGKSASELSLAESAYLAALPQAPSYYSPTGDNYDALVKRQNQILQLMHDQGYITELEMHQAQNQQVAFREPKTEIIAPYFVSYIQNYLTEKYGKEFLKQGGLRVYTTLDLNLQTLAEQVVKDGAAQNKRYGAYNAALVAVEPSTGKILAMAGGKDYFGSPEPKGCKPGVNCKFEPNVNVATSPRQPGSSFKPYMYLTGFEPQYGLTPMSKVLDVPTSFGNYVPRNYDGSSRGLITIRQALAMSLNVPAVRTLATIGVDPVTQTAHDLGITSPLKNCGLSLVLGGCEIKLVDHVGAFAVLANGGKGKGATPFNRIEDKHGNVLEQYQKNETQAVNAEAVYELISIMTDNAARTPVFGPHSPLEYTDRPVACKTGTTQNWKDGWTMCFTPQLAAGVWAGNNDSSLMRAGADGVFVAAPMEHAFMEAALKGQPAVDFPVPPGIVQIAYSGSRPAGKAGPGTHMEPFPWYALPNEVKVSAAPKSLNKATFTPVDTPAPLQPTPLTEPSNLPSNKIVTPPAPNPNDPNDPINQPPSASPFLNTPISPTVTQNIPSSPYNSQAPPDYPDYGGLPNDYPTEPQVNPNPRP